MNNNCNLTTCRYNADGKCMNEEKREECVRVSKTVLCIDDDNDKNPLNVCETNNGGYVKFDFNGKRYIYYNCFVESIADID